MALMFRSSTRITSNRRARPVEAFSAQSLRRSLSRAFSRARDSLTSVRRLDPRLARASLLSSFRSRACSRLLRPGTLSISPVDSAADTATPRSIPTTSPVPGPSTGSGITANATCHQPARSRVTRYDFTSPGMARDQRNRTQPTFGTFTSPQFRFSLRTSHCRPRWPTIRKPSSWPFLRHRGRRRAPAKKAAMACAKSRSACCCTACDPARSQSLPARVAVSCLHCSR